MQSGPFRKIGTRPTQTNDVVSLLYFSHRITGKQSDWLFPKSNQACVHNEHTSTNITALVQAAITLVAPPDHRASKHFTGHSVTRSPPHFLDLNTRNLELTRHIANWASLRAIEPDPRS